MADVRLSLNLGNTTLIIHDTDPRPDAFNSCDPARGGGDTVEVREGNNTAHFTGYAAYNRIVQLGVRQMRTIDYSQLRQIASHLDAARSALNAPDRLVNVDRELSAVQGLLEANHISSSRGAIAREINLIRHTALEQGLVTFASNK